MSDFTKQQFSPSNGFLNESSYPNPETGQESREQLFSLHAQTRNFINAHIDELENKDAGFDGKSSGADRIGSAEVPGLVDPDAPAAAAKTVRSQIRALLIALSSSGGNLQDQIDDETAAREAQDEALTGAIAAEADTREDADDALAAGLAAETEAREADVADITEALALKNALLIAGENITITDNGDGTQTISFSEFDLFIVAEELPAVGIENRIYLIPEEGGQSFSEHFYKDGAWEDFGTLTVDLSNYYTKTQTDSKIANSAATLAPKSHAATETTYGAASTTSYGHMRFATDAEVNTGTATDKAVTPKQLKTGLDGV
ncbi:MAG: hypothetical protein LBS24_00350, partial [Clostridiales Family XIII bacterium]|nr:hypothetical protein [Clostridiales Family XIII bacterium]